jgi:hypothetical protein
METCMGERKLLCAIIEQAYMDATGRGRQKRDAEEWLNSKRNYPFSFIWICHHLQIDPSIIRRNINSRAKNNGGLNRSEASS